MKYFQPTHIINIIEEKRVQFGSKGSRQWKILKQFNGKTVEKFELAAKKSTNLSPSETYQKGKWWERELDYCHEKKVIRIQASNNYTHSKTATSIKDDNAPKSVVFLNQNIASIYNGSKINENRVNMNETGVYMAYPTSSVLKLTYRGAKSQVNDKHTKIGITEDSFFSRKTSYINTFDGEVEFIPIIAVKKRKIERS